MQRLASFVNRSPIKTVEIVELWRDAGYHCYPSREPKQAGMRATELDKEDLENA